MVMDDSEYIPKQGDIISLNFSPQRGHEQKGHRPAIVVSKYLFNKTTGLAMVCPITNTDRSIPFHVAVADYSSKISGFIMVEQIKSIDFKARKARRLMKVNQAMLSRVTAILEACIF